MKKKITLKLLTYREVVINSKGKLTSHDPRVSRGCGEIISKKYKKDKHKNSFLDYDRAINLLIY